jgi:hypothetical protein
MDGAPSVALTTTFWHGASLSQMPRGPSSTPSHQPFLLGCTYLLAEAGSNKVNGLENQLRTAREPLLARCDNAVPRTSTNRTFREAPARSGSLKILQIILPKQMLDKL